ncbi:pin domain-like protein [Diplodia corticola]|uniref:Pin domain-like protein n=1 Tax=Diplodia corticola TaxID=236234 RepID=A0A1J9S2G9_9PEZI|nr:pin domain-like protein [Diplodia corticola]OJD34767.1 pin domain-like protein [Diplodia corticola]
MGISGLLPLLKSIHKQCHLRQFAGQTLGVDAYGWLHRGTVACAIDLALDKPTRKHIDYCMHRVRMLIHFGIKPYLVFDGDHLPGKEVTNRERAAKRKESRKAGTELLKLGKASQAHLELQKAVDVTPEMARMLIEELKLLGVDYVVAPYEADSQMVYLEKKGIIQGIISEDSDLLVFGAKCLITKLDNYGECIAINRSDFTACKDINLVGWSDAQFRQMAILSGCDYLPSISKMGLMTAYRLLRKHKTVERVLRQIQFDGKFKMPAGYPEAYAQAELTFLYQWVFCPSAKRLVHFTKLDPDVEMEKLLYIGRYIEPEIAAGVAQGELHPNTKRPIDLPQSFRAIKLPTPVSRRVSAMQTPDLKKSKSIDSFFKPKRIPLAELDLNLFNPSPSQQQTLQENENRGSWSASPVPPQAARPTAAPTSVPPQLSRRIASEPWVTRRSSTSRPAKRQRLCSDTTVLPGADGSFRVESGTSRFFTSTVEPSPSNRRSKSKKMGAQDFELWSDDSIEEAMKDLPDPSQTTTESKASQTSRTSSLKRSLSTSLGLDSQDTNGSSTPATSSDSQSAPCETQTTETETQDVGDFKDLARMFEHKPASQKRSQSSRLAEESSWSKKGDESLSSISATSEDSKVELDSLATSHQVSSSSKDADIFDDDDWTGNDAEIAVPCSSQAEPVDDVTPKASKQSPLDMALPTTKGSEDLDIIPDSESEGALSDVEDRVKAMKQKLDLERFRFGVMR